MTTALAEAPSTRRSKTKHRKPVLRELEESFRPEALTWRTIDWPVLLWITAMHAGCLAAPFFVSWPAVGVMVVLHFVTGGVGICLGYHRFLAHRGMRLARPVQFLVYLIGCVSAEGTPLTWAAVHRMHHARSDKPGDPHSPKDGKWWSHILWLFVRRGPKLQAALYRKYVPDLLDDPLLRFFERSFIFWSILLGAALYYFGGWPMLIWGLCVRMTSVYHSTWFVNSATHLWGYRNYETQDQSRNLWWVAFLTCGEGWHNNHHAFPRVARHGHRWFELDPVWWTIRALKAVGLAWDVQEQKRLPQRYDNRQPV